MQVDSYSDCRCVVKYKTSFKISNKTVNSCIFQLDCLMINFLDDYHNIHTRKVPTDLQKTKVAHMASSMVDIHAHIPAIKKTNVSPHREVKVKIKGEEKMCLGGADSSTVISQITKGLKEMRNHFIDQLPVEMRNLNPGNFQILVQNFRYVLLMINVTFTN